MLPELRFRQHSYSTLNLLPACVLCRGRKASLISDVDGMLIARNGIRIRSGFERGRDMVEGP